MNKFIKKGKNKYFECFTCVDIETSHNHDESNPKGWIVSIATYDGSDYNLYRYPSEFSKNYILPLWEKCIDNNAYYVIYIHNLSYDITFLLKWICKELDYDYNEVKILAVGSHKIITCDIGFLKFRCSWKLSNRSLENWTQELNVEHKKLAGYYDYNKILYPDSKLTDKEKDYDANDVIGMYECIIKTLDIYGYNIANIPLTSTSLIRSDARKHFREDIENRKLFLKTKLSYELYELACRAYHGGFTHGNREYKNILIDLNNLDFSQLKCDNVKYIKHRDERSFYPSRLRCKKYPIGEYVLYANENDDLSIDDILSQADDYSFLVEIYITNLTVKKGVYFPILQTYKLKSSPLRSDKLIITDDNGRVLEIQTGYSVIVLTELELEYLKKQYTFDYNILRVYKSKKDYIPQWLADTIDTYFYNKTSKKEEESKLEKLYGIFDDRYIFAHNELMKSKNGLNGIYGMSATNPIRDIFALDIDSGIWTKEKRDTQEKIETLEKYYNGRNNFMSYQYGLYTTALAEYELLNIIDIIGQERVLYIDTDSAYYLSNDDVEKRIEEYNKKTEQQALEHGAYIIYNDKKYTYDGFYEEPGTIESFKFLHSKCYGFTTKEDGLSITVAGVKKYITLPNGKKYFRENELGNLDNLKEGFKFKKCGSMKSKYKAEEPHIEYINNHKVEIADFCIIEPCTYEIKSMEDQFDIDYIESYETPFLQE